MTVFLVLGVVGLVLLGLSLLLGDLFGGALDALAGDVFSSAVIGGFVSAFGFGAALSEGLDAPLWLAVVRRRGRRGGVRLVRLLAHASRPRRRERRDRLAPRTRSGATPRS